MANRRLFCLIMRAAAIVLAPEVAPLHAADAPVDRAKLPPAATRQVSFGTEIKPLLEASCLKCHSGEKPKGKYSLVSRELALKPGDDGPNILPGKSAESRLIHFVSRLVEDMEMPPADKGKPLTGEQVGMLRAWIDQGAAWPAEVVLRAPEEAPNSQTSDAASKKAALPPPAAKQIDFVKDVQPIFAGNCLGCHGPKKQEAEFRL